MLAAAFRTLGVNEDAAWTVIRARYRDLARRFHPDGTTPDVERMTEINRAYELLERARRRTADGARPPVPVGPGHPVGRPAVARPRRAVVAGQGSVQDPDDTPAA